MNNQTNIYFTTINVDNTCSILVSGANYVFTVNGVSVTMPRGATGSSASGYQQYPYFGGDETASHDITIRIKKSFNKFYNIKNLINFPNCIYEM